jgi:hypothetical protein
MQRGRPKNDANDTRVNVLPFHDTISGEQRYMLQLMQGINVLEEDTADGHGYKTRESAMASAGHLWNAPLDYVAP